MFTSPSAWRPRVWAEFHAQNLTRASRDVLLTLATYRGPGGNAWPAHATLAARVGCSVRTVQRALARAAELGLVAWTERRVRAGWRWLRTSNVYRLLTPASAVENRPRAMRLATTGQKERGVENKKNKQALRAMLEAAAKLPDLLAARRREIELRLQTARSLASDSGGIGPYRMESNTGRGPCPSSSGS